MYGAKTNTQLFDINIEHILLLLCEAQSEKPIMKDSMHVHRKLVDDEEICRNYNCHVHPE